MTAPPLSTTHTRPTHAFGYYDDPVFECTVVATSPTSRPDLWHRYLEGARISYERHDVSVALEYDTIRDGRNTTIFLCALDASGRMLAGIRVQGPYEHARQTHADLEWRRNPLARTVLRDAVTERLREGVIELKSGWVDRAAPRDRRLVDMIAHAGPLACSLLGVRFALSTAADHAVSMWQKSGAVVADTIDPTPYPDDRYSTRALWWDLHTFRETAHAHHARRIDDAAAQLVHTWSTGET
ncbi:MULTISPECIES: hypothetical protein [Nocardiaceae]|uniref:GNAT family N-acetyltransferase n=1 Tax=Rhodococcoides corynebacterioides TaxID=53972 RepID=A0ABS2KTH8_9NOCA|nr:MULTISPECIES: hypothetical protein [Rhodococcus]MBM7415239.1 hypothetical protein [Rhodococcus corynebacterioides]MBP1117701.1 hypothetical protein [Rhodococcus sp. PvP016]